MLPVVKYSPVGAVLLTCSGYTHHAEVTTFAPHAALLATHACPASERVRGDILVVGSLFLTIVDDAPCKSACTYMSPFLQYMIDFG